MKTLHEAVERALVAEAALESAERERDELRRRVDDNWTQSAYDACCDSRDEAEARAQKAEAALRKIVRLEDGRGSQIALAALDERA